MTLRATLQQIKHRGFLARKTIVRARDRAKVRRQDKVWARRAERRQFHYVDGMFPHTFLSRRTPDHRPELTVPESLWAFWLGGTPNPRRAASLDALRAQERIRPRIVTDGAELELPDHPFHPAYAHLHVIHRSDYLRAYVMHHHGGVYADVKPFTGELHRAVDALNADSSAWVVGYREITSQYVGDLPHALGGYLRAHYRAVIGPSGFACRPGTPFTAEWMREMHARLDYYLEPLREADAAACDPYNAPPEYPIRWSEILGDIIQPLCLKHQEHIRFSDLLKPQLKDYR